MVDPNPSPSGLFTRRHFLANAGKGMFAASLAVKASGAGLSLPQIHAATEQKSGPVPDPLPPGERIGFAIVGLGHLALNQVLPALVKCNQARLAALVSGSPEKARTVARQYGLDEKFIYDYKNFDTLKDNPAVDVVYIILPNGMHAEYTVRGAEAGKHILCEKPMANSVGECEQMIAACKKADRKLMIAYRIQYEPHHRLIQKWFREKRFGTAKVFESYNSQNDTPNQWRQNKRMAGGGALPDVGLYCLNTSRFLSGEEPTEVSAMIYSTPGDPRFKEVEECVHWQMHFPSGLMANCGTSYGVHESRRYRVNAETGWFGMDPAFSYTGLEMECSQAEGPIDFRSHPGIEAKDQFTLEMDHMAECVRKNETPFTPGEEGLQDQRIMEAIYRSAAEKKVISLLTPEVPGKKLDVFRGTIPRSDS